jgi:DNA repair protein SbcC/Rad50
MITGMKLKNWRSHLDSTFNFESGTNALIGIMGSGKSSVMDGICLGLFGTSPALQTKKVKLDDMIMKKPVEKSSAEVEIFLKIDGNDYSVKRVIEKGRGTTYSEIRENGKLLEAPSTSRVTEILENILKINFELFSKAIYSEQDSLDYFLTIPRGQRMRRIDELLMIDKFERARSSAVSLVNRFEERRLARQSVVENADIESIRKIISGINESLHLLELEIESLKKDFDQTKSQKESIETVYNQIIKLTRSSEELKLSIEKNLSTLKEIEHSISDMKTDIRNNDRVGVEKENEYLSDKIGHNKEELQRLKNKFDSSSNEISELKSKSSYLKKEIEILEKEFYEISEVKKDFEHLRDSIGENIDEQLAAAKNSLQKITGLAARILGKISDNEQFIVHLSASENKCPICDSTLTSERKKLLILQKERDIKQLREEFTVAEENKRQTEEKIRILEDAKERTALMKEKIMNLENVKLDLEKAKRSYVEESSRVVYSENSLTDLRREIEKIQDEIDNDKLKHQGLQILLEKIVDLEKKTERKLNLENEISVLQKQFSELIGQLKGKNIEEIEIELRNLISKEKEIETKNLGVERVAKEKQLRLDEYESKLEDMRKYQAEIAKLQKIIKNMKIFEKSLQQTQVELRKEFVEAVNYTMTNLWQTLYPYQDFVGIRLNVEEGDYVLQLLERTGKWVNVEGIVSGGERSIAALALRIAFSLVLAPQLRWLILDEPTHNLDQNAVEDLAETLRERIGEFVDQVFLITHDEKLENAVTGSLYRLEREKEKDGVTKVILIS